MTWPSFFAAAIRAGVTGSGGGASAITRVENVVAASTPLAALSTSRRDNPCFFIGPFCRRFLEHLFKHDLRANAPGVCREGKPVANFPDHALEVRYTRNRFLFLPRKPESIVDSLLSLQLDLTVSRESWIWPAAGPTQTSQGPGRSR